MAAYATRADMATKYGEAALAIASDRDGDDATDDAAITLILDNVTSKINSYVGVQYDLPLATVPESLRDCAIDMGMHDLCLEHSVMTEEKENRNKACIRWLELLAKGTLTLGLEDPPTSTVASPQHATQDRIFGREQMKGIL